MRCVCSWTRYTRRRPRAEAQQLAEGYNLRRVLTENERVVKTFDDGGGATENMNRRMHQNDPNNMLLAAARRSTSSSSALVRCQIGRCADAVWCRQQTRVKEDEYQGG